MTPNPSKFAKVADAVKGREPETEPTPPAVEPPPPSSRGGRPKGGRRSDPAFMQVSAYIPVDLQEAVAVKLIKSHRRFEFSVLVTDLLREWADGKHKPNGW